MKATLLLSIFFLISCASGPERKIASVETPIIFGEVDTKHSHVRLFPTSTGQPELHHFFLELRNAKKDLVDVALEDMNLREFNKKKNTLIRRISLGRYEIEVNKDHLEFNTLKFLVQRKTIKHKFVPFRKPIRTHSAIVFVINEHHRIKARLILKDKLDSEVEVEGKPEVIFEGLAEVSVPKMVKTGLWEFDIAYPEVNQIIYLSVRANGVLLDRLYRFQHVEK